MRLLAGLAIAALAVFSSSAGAQAGMLPPLPSLDQPGNTDDSDSGSNWYLRGVLGAGLAGNLSVKPGFLRGAVASSQKSRTGWAVGGALGYQLGWLRADLSVDYLGERNVSERFAGPCADCSGRFSSKFSAVPVLANVYYDIGTWRGLTPYLGVGAGLTHIDWDRGVVTGMCGDACPVVSGAGHWRFAWQAGGGVNYAVTDKVSIDADYRLLDLGAGRAGVSAEGDLRTRPLWDNEVRLALRYKLN